MEITISSVTFSLSSGVVIFLIVACLYPQLLPNLIEAIKGWKNQ